MEKKNIQINIREKMRDFLLQDVIKPCIDQPHLSHIKNSILILDKYTTVILNSCMKMIDLVENGIIGMNINVKRNGTT